MSLTTTTETQILQQAKEIVSKSNFFTFLLTLILIKRTNRPYIYCWYAYFRWVDDTADKQGISKEEKIKFIDSQILLVGFLYDEKIDNLSHSNESFLSQLVAFDLKRGAILKVFITDMLRCIQFDITRLETYSARKDIDYYFNLEVLSYLNTFSSFCDTNASAKIINSNEGIAGKWIHVIRDYRKDINEEIFNLPKEDVIDYDIDITKKDFIIDTENFKMWVSDKLLQTKENFKIGKKELAHNPCLRYKLLVLILCFKYQLYQKLIIKNKFLLKREYRISKLLIITHLPGLIVEIISFSLYDVLIHKLKSSK